jgi:hypothetical protein
MPSIPLTELAGLIESRINQVIQEQNLGGKKNLKASKKASARLAIKVLKNAVKSEKKATVKDKKKSAKMDKGKNEHRSPDADKNVVSQPDTADPATQK